MADEVLLKKYMNRRLYDTEKSAYVTLSEVSDLIREGREVRIIDARSEEDVTASVLMQIVVEETKKNNALLPVSLLLLIIRYGENILGEFFEKYLEVSIRNYLALKETFDGQLKKWLEMGADFSGLTRDSKTPFSALNSLSDFYSKAGSRPKDE